VKRRGWFFTTLWVGLSVLTFSAAHAQDRFSRAQEYEKEMRWEEALSEYTEILKKDPTNALAHYHLGVVQEKVGATEAAVQSYQEALRLNPNLTDVRRALEGYYVNQGIAFRLNHQSDAAINAFQQALSFNPSSASAYFELGQELEQRGQADEAVTAYQEAIRLDPNKSAAHARLAAVYANLGQHEQAREEFQAVLRFNPQDPAAHHGLGVAYSELGQRDRAIESLQQAVRFYLIFGQRDQARPAYELQKQLLAEKGTTSSTGSKR
jgi:tetratricopeptide (TPR) repeat protein